MSTAMSMVKSPMMNTSITTVPDRDTAGRIEDGKALPLLAEWLHGHIGHVRLQYVIR